MTTKRIPKCELEFIPKVGQYFKTLNHAYNFYEEYGKKCGFDIRRATQKKHKDGTIMLKHFLCSRAGFNCRDNFEGANKRKTMNSMCGCEAKIVLKYAASNGYVVRSFEEMHNHEFSSTEGNQFMRFNRNVNDTYKGFIFNASKVNIGATKAHSLLKEMVGGYGNIGATSVDFKNINRDIKLYIGDNDARMIIQKFVSKKEICEGFYFEYDVDSEDHLTRLFWADPIARRNYDTFGDVVSFDATYSTNKYVFVYICV